MDVSFGRILGKDKDVNTDFWTDLLHWYQPHTTEHAKICSSIDFLKLNDVLNNDSNAVTKYLQYKGDFL